MDQTKLFLVGVYVTRNYIIICTMYTSETVLVDILGV